LREYLARSDDRATVEQLRPRIAALFAFLQPLRNSDGLLESLPGWVFVEWSSANDFVQDVNYPSNMLFAAALDAASELYNRPEWARDAARVRDVIRKQSFDGSFFVDNAVRHDGQLKPTRNRTEVCQYFAFYFGIATPASHPELWRTLKEKFGPERAKKGDFPEVGAANAFVGNVVRLELLSQEGLGQQLLDETVSYLLYMADRTGTLWENDTAVASCDHGFASHIVRVLYRDVLGVHELDYVNKRVELRLLPLDVNWCRGCVPTPEGPATFEWYKVAEGIKVRLGLPAGYTARITNGSGLRLVPFA
jgi:alpha-L-rhamnosidase